MLGELQQLIGKKCVGTRILTLSKNTIEESSHNVYINKSTYNISLFLTDVLFGDNHFFELIIVTNLMFVAPRNLPLHILTDIKVIPLWAKVIFQLCMVGIRQILCPSSGALALANCQIPHTVKN